MGAALRNHPQPRIYVACLSAKSSGYRYGVWIDAAQEPWAIWDTVQEMLRASPVVGADEWAIRGYDGFGVLRLNENTYPRSAALLCRLASMTRDAELSGDVFTLKNSFEFVRVFAGW